MKKRSIETKEHDFYQKNFYQEILKFIKTNGVSQSIILSLNNLNFLSIL